jgi:hypothetical protein
MKEKNILICDEFNKYTGPRYIHEGEYSGESFRRKILEPEIKKSIEENIILIVDLDGAKFITSFLEEAFGGVVRSLDGLYNLNIIKQHLVIKSEQRPFLRTRIIDFMNNAIK